MGTSSDTQEELVIAEIHSYINRHKYANANKLNKDINDILSGKFVLLVKDLYGLQGYEMFKAELPNYVALLEYYQNLEDRLRPTKLHFSFTNDALLEQAAKEILRVNEALASGKYEAWSAHRFFGGGVDTANTI